MYQIPKTKVAIKAAKDAPKTNVKIEINKTKKSNLNPLQIFNDLILKTCRLS
jgi:hypothetical protein